MGNAGMQLFGDKALKRTFEQLGERVQRKILRSGVSAAATPTAVFGNSMATSKSSEMK